MEDDDALTKDGIIRTIYDPTAGTGGFLSSGMEYVHELNPNAVIRAFGQELNPESYAICKADMLIKGQEVQNIKLGNTLSNDQLYSDKFDYMLSNPPFGVDWKKIEGDIKDEHTLKGFDGRFGAGLPRVSDGSLLFLLHLISKLRDAKDGGARIGIILNGSPLFTGGAGSGESEIRRYILEADLLEAIVALPTDMFYNTGISTYIWILSNKKAAQRKGKVQLINAVNLCGKMRKSLGSKRNEMDESDIATVTRAFGEFAEIEARELDKPAEQKSNRGRQSAHPKTETAKTFASKIFNTYEFGYRRITIERPLRESYQFSDERLDSLIATAPLFAKTKQLQSVIGLAQCDDMNTFDDALKIACKKATITLDTKEKKQLKEVVSWRNPTAEKVIKKIHKGKANPLYGLFEVNGEIIEYQADSELRDNENVALNPALSVNDINEAYFKKEVLPHVPDAWMDASKRDDKDGEIGIVGYEIPFNRHFYQYQPPRDLVEIDADLDALSVEIMALLQEVHS
jgi:type I restriction enzyme M protein